MTVQDWLLDGDPALRWQVLRDLSDAPPEAVAAERARVATEGWGARLLALRGDDGQWAGGACFPADFCGDFSQGQPWTATFPTLTLLRDFGIDPHAQPVREMVALVRENCRWEHAGQPFFAGEVEPCINGRTVAIGAYFGVDVDGIVARLLDEQLADGGWNCEAENGSVRSSFATTICVLEGLLEHERATGGTARAVAARRRGEQYLLDRRLFRRLSTGEVVDPDWLRFSYPTWWHYDVLRALDYFRTAGDAPDPRLAEAVAMLGSKRQPDGTWLLEHTHPGAVHFSLEDGVGKPSRWNTLRALRVLNWYSGRAGSVSAMATVGRFAPSPTGALHLGSARTALLAWLVARSAPGGRCLLRIDDLDRPRVRAGAEDGQRADLAWLGLDFDPPELRQSARAGAYDAALRTLDDRGLLYRCVCTRRHLAAISAPHGPEGPRYPGTCRPPGPPAPLGRLDGPGSLRLRLPAGEIAVDDLVAGRFTSDPQAPDGGGDVVVRRADGLHGYHLATVVDDAASGVTVVVRGDDLLASTPRQVAIGRALGVATPAYAHVPLVLDEHGERLAKRRRPAAIADLRARGQSAARVVGALAWSAGLADEPADRTPAELLAGFELASLADRLAAAAGRSPVAALR